MSAHTEQPRRRSSDRTTQNLSFSLPTLARYTGVPKRYEETRPVLIQGHAHRRILNIGHELHRQTLDIAELEKLKSIRDAETSVWVEAELIKNAALARSREEAAIEQERVIEKFNKVHQKALKEEALRVEMAMQKLAIEQVKQARMEGEERLTVAVRAAEEKGRAELKIAVEVARKEEKEMAAREVARIIRIHEDKFKAAAVKAKEEKRMALIELETAKNSERVKAVAEVEQRERSITVEKIKLLTAEFQQKIVKLGKEIQEKLAEIKKREKQILEVEAEKKKVEAVLADTQRDFQDFIDRIQHFEDKSGQADYMVRPVYLDEITKVMPLKPCV
ncbi:uncharacterized protein C6orf163 homolog [Mizuhopecten yessoensis]|uniref:Uncharacterized protein n=1 Tax=Mizuhopecten yessoensis TaxID=6573 RepID=A0A210QKM6_MIZYE|nr:uncharacterized protein C6orf163 homolog [Mizuhopecten yessoensis]OWF49256.1 hypothetical protein KP79_PYT16929 [Mizuhopecten yessoensis]